MEPILSRRGVLIGGGLCTLAACGLAACASYGPEEEEPAGLTAPTTDIPVGGGAVFAEQKVVITQPTAGEFKAFNATCTHQGCIVGAVTTTIDCPCHGSKFAITDGSVVNGPAKAPLAPLTASVSGSEVTVG